jgi:hypothetical protein
MSEAPRDFIARVIAGTAQRFILKSAKFAGRLSGFFEII